MSLSTRIKTLRKKRGLTLEQLAELTKLSRGYLSRVERSDRPPPFSTLESIAAALNVDMEELIEVQAKREGTSDIEIVRKGVPEVMVSSSANYAFKPLASGRGKHMSPFLMKIEPGTTKYFKHDAEEFVYVAKGSVTLEYGKHTYELRAGDSFYLDSRIRHRFVNKNSSNAELVAVHFTYRQF